MRRKINAALIGLGNIGYKYAFDTDVLKRMKNPTHFRTIIHHPGFELAAVCETDKTATAFFKRTARVKVDIFNSVTDLLKKREVDLVVVATPTGVHFKTCRTALENGVKMILCEKPISLNFREADKLSKIVKKKSAIFFCDYFRNYNSNYLNLFAEIKSGKYGKLQAFSGCYAKGVYNNGSHLLALLSEIVGDKLSIKQNGKAFYDKDSHDPTISFSVNSKTASGYIYGLDSHFYNIFSLDLFMEKCVLSINNDRLSIRPVKRRGVDGSFGKPIVVNNFDIKAGLYPVYNNIFNAYFKKVAPLYGIDQASNLVSTIEKSITKS